MEGSRYEIEEEKSDGSIEIEGKTLFLSLDSWPSARPGVLSTAGTTVSACVIRGRDLYVGHLGDSGIVLAKKRADKDKLVARSLTVDHKPESESEKNRIESAGGEVRLGNGRVHRVVWNRIRQPHCGPVLRSTERESVPFLSVARSLGDLWSYNYEKGRYVVSPEPDVSFRRITLETDRFLVFASDGLWAVMSHQEAVDFVARHRRESDDVEEDDENGSRVCSMLVQEGLQRWKNRSSRADNISVILAFFHKPKKNAAVKAATATEPEPAGETQSLERGISDDDVVVPPTPPTQDVDVVPPTATTTTTTSSAQKRKRKRKSASKNQKKRKVELLSSSSMKKMPELSNGDVSKLN